jgi:hypothetical protein
MANEYFEVGTHEIKNGAVVDADVNSGAAIVESKLTFNTSSGHNHDGSNSRIVSGGGGGTNIQDLITPVNISVQGIWNNDDLCYYWDLIPDIVIQEEQFPTNHIFCEPVIIIGVVTEGIINPFIMNNGERTWKLNTVTGKKELIIQLGGSAGNTENIGTLTINATVYIKGA